MFNIYLICLLVFSVGGECLDCTLPRLYPIFKLLRAPSPSSYLLRRSTLRPCKEFLGMWRIQVQTNNVKNYGTKSQLIIKIETYVKLSVSFFQIYHLSKWWWWQHQQPQQNMDDNNNNKDNHIKDNHNTDNHNGGDIKNMSMTLTTTERIEQILKIYIYKL